MNALLLLLIVGFTSCDNTTTTSPEENSGTLTLNFQSTFDSQPLVMLGSEYAYEGGVEVMFQLFQFFVSSIKLIDQSGNVGPEIKDIALISFDGVNTLDSSRQGINLEIPDLPIGDYQGIQLGIGVNSALNSTMPNQYAVGHPLSAHYWDAANSYIFTKIEGVADTDNDGTFEQKLTFHIGGDPRYREVDFDQSFSISSNSSTSLGFTVDVKDIFVGDDGSYIDFREVTQIHNGSMPAAVAMMDRFSIALKLQN